MKDNVTLDSYSQNVLQIEKERLRFKKWNEVFLEKQTKQQLEKSKVQSTKKLFRDDMWVRNPRATDKKSLTFRIKFSFSGIGVMTLDMVLAAQGGSDP